MREAAADCVFKTVSRCRLRMQLVSAVRRAGIAIPIAFVTVEIVALASATTPARIAILAAAAVALAATTAALPSILRAPSMRAAAAAIDARLRLQDRIVTAVQLLDNEDAMARLVVRDAGTRLVRLSPAHVFPFEAPSNFRAALAAVLATTVVFLATTARPGSSWKRSGGSNDGPGAGAAQSGRTAKPSSNARVIEGAARSTSSESRPSVTSQTSANREDTPAGRDSAWNDPDAQTLARSGSVPRPADSPASTSARDAGAAAGARDSARGATGFSEQSASAAGGVSGTVNASPNSVARRSPLSAVPASATYRNQYRIASSRAENPVARERVPSRLRTYVKRYFVAIHP